jgi:hypothetical protein
LVTTERGAERDAAQPQLRVFLNYRRSDTAPYARLLGDALRSRFGEEHVFTDVDAIGLGADFPRVIAERVESSDVLLALIGKEWLTATGEQGERRLAEAGDWVRLEIETALQRDVPVVPTLVEGATMPSPHDVPDALKPLTTRNGIELRDGGPWDSDVERLLRALERIASEKAEREKAEREAASRAAATPDPAAAAEAPSEPPEHETRTEPQPPPTAPKPVPARTPQLTLLGMAPQAAQLLNTVLLRAVEPDDNVLAVCRYAEATLPPPDGHAADQRERRRRPAAPWRYAGNVVATEQQLVFLSGWPKVERHVNVPWSRIRSARIEAERYGIWRIGVREGARVTFVPTDGTAELSFVSYDRDRAKALHDVAAARIRAGSSER